MQELIDKCETAGRSANHGRATSFRSAAGLMAVLIAFFVMAGAPMAVADPSSPITLSNVASPSPVASGTEITYTITVVNTAGSKITNVVMADQLNGVGGIGVPPQLVISSTRGSCTQSTTLVTCNAGTIEGGGAWFVTIRGAVTAAAGTTINNTVTVTGTHSAQNFTTTTTTSTLVTAGGGSALPDLTISKNGPTSVLVSSPMTYTLTVNNIGTANATGVKVVDTLPAGLTGITASGTSLFVCGVSGQTVTCTGGAVNQGSNATITINATSPSTTGSITNTAAVDPDDTILESNELNNTSSLVNTQVTSTTTPDQLTITVVDNPDPVIPGATLTWTILVTNATTQRADDVVIVDGTQGLEPSSIQVSQVVTNGTVGNTGGCTVSAPQAVCSDRTLNAGGTILMTVSGQVVAAAGSTIIDTASVTGNIKNTGTTTTATQLTTVMPGIDLTITNSDAPDPVCARSWPGAAPLPLVCRGGLTYTFVVGNSGINTASNVLVRDPLPPGVIFDSFTAPAFSGGCSVDASNVLTCTGGTIGPQSTTTIIIVCVAPAVTGSITNTVTVDPNNAIFESDETNNTATQVTQVITGIDLTISKSSAINPIATSGTETYTILVNNLGTQDATNIRVRDTLPSGTIFRDVTSDHGFTCSQAGGVVECVGGAIKGTASNNYAPLGGALANPPDTATITVRIFAQSFAGSMHNEARVDPLGEIAEADETNNIATQDTVVGSFPTGHGSFNQLNISKNQVSPDKTNTARNAIVTWSIVVGNVGTDPAVGVTVRDYLMAGARYIQATGTNMFNCNQIGGSTGYIDCVGGVIASMGSATITLTAFAPDTPGTYVNQAIVDPDNTIPEGDELDNQAQETTIVTNGGLGAYNDLTITKTGTANTTPGGTISYSLTIGNTGAADALNVAVRDALPAGETFVSAADTGGSGGAAFTCSASSNTVNCIGATIPAGGSRSIGIVAIAPQQNTSLLNEAVVDPDNLIPEGNEFNNTATAPTTVSAALNLTITADGPTSASQSDTTDYTITVTNNTVSGSGQNAIGVVMYDTLPPGLIPLGVDTGSGNNWACTFDQNPINFARCVGDLPAGGNVTITIHVFITAESGTTLDNQACVDPDNVIVESNELDNCAELGTFVTGPQLMSPDLFVNKSVDNLSPSPGTTLTYHINVQNTGTAKAKTPVVITDTLPSQVAFQNTTSTPSWTCTQSSGTVTCQDGGSGLDVGGSVDITIQGKLSDTATGTISNTASVPAATADCTDPTQCENETFNHLANNTSTVTSSIGSSGIDLYVASVTDQPDPVAPGKPLKYTIVAGNAGTAAANGAHIEVDLPTAGVTFSGASGSNGFACDGPDSSMKLDCHGDLPAGGTTTLIVDVQVQLSPPPPTILNLTATADPANAFAETNEGNNTITATTSVTGSGCTSCIDLVASLLTVTPEPLGPGGGGNATLNFVVANVGDQATSLILSPPPPQKLLSLEWAADGSVGIVTPTSSDPSITCQIDSPLSPTPPVTNVHASCSGNLGPNSAVTITVLNIAVTGTGLTVTGVADPNNHVSEADETNNQIVQTVVILP